MGVDNPQLTPETIGTLEAQVGYVNKVVDANLTFFYNKYNDFMQELWATSVKNPDGTTRLIDGGKGDEMSFNMDTRSTAGLELFGKVQPAKDFEIIAGVSRKLLRTETLGADNLTGITLLYPNRVNAGSQDINYLSDWTANLSATYKFLKRYRIGVSGNFYSARSTDQWYQSESGVQDPANADGFVLMNLFGDIDIYKGLAFRWKVQNVLNSESYSPPYGSYGGPEQYDLQWPSRTYWLGLTWKF